MISVGLVKDSSSWTEFEKALVCLGTDRNAEKGRAFEELTRLYLLTDPIFTTKLSDVWHSTNIPQSVVDELELQRPEIGVDLIAHTHDGAYWAIQCKFHQDRSQNVTYDELKTFLSITERHQTYARLSHRLVCTSANGISRRVTQAHPHKLGILTAAEFTKLGAEDFGRFRELLAGEKPVLKPILPRSHQRRAVHNAVKHFHDGGHARGKLIHPCGSGKSLTGYWIGEAFWAKSVVVAVPSLSLVRQTLGTWARESVAKQHDMRWLAVCSDEDVAKSDDPAMRSVDLGIDVTTDPRIVAAFLSAPSRSVKVLMTTYQSGPVVSEGARQAGFTFDLGIFDEAHKTVGSKGGLFAHLLSDANIQIGKRVFMTATERQYRGNSDDIYSMDDCLVYGDIFDLLSFKAALELDPPILSDYRILSIVVTKSEIERLIAEQAFIRSDGKNWSLEADAPTFAALVALRKSIDKYGINHTVSFHRSIQRSRDFAKLNEEANKAGQAFGCLHCFHVSGEVSTGKRAAITSRFVDYVPSLITNARCLTEGVDVPAIDGVLFADPRQSRVDIVQAAGRAMRRFEGKGLGYIIVPVVIDEESSEPSDEAFEQIIAVLSALATQDERIIEEFKSIASGKSSSGSTLVVIDVPEFVRIEFGDLITNIDTRVWDRLGRGWGKGFESLKAFVAREGHAKVPQRYSDDAGFRLGTWVTNRRKYYRNGKLLPERIAALEALPDWAWNTYEDEFDTGFERLQQFVASEGQALVPAAFTDETGFRLGSWVNGRRQDQKKGKLPEDRIALLEGLSGWTWDVLEDGFQTGFESLKRFVSEEGHALVPKGYQDEAGYGLGSWVHKNRRYYTKDQLSPERIAALQAVPGWAWNARDHRFEAGLVRLKEFVTREGQCLIPAAYVDETGFNLGLWVTTQHSNFKKDIMTPERIATLEEIPGWAWERDTDNYEKGMESLREFVAREGHSRVPASYTDEMGFRLGSWVLVRRQDFKKVKLLPERVTALESLPGWCWDTRDYKFEQGLARLREFVTQNGHSQVLASYTDETNFPLGSWVSARRGTYNKGKLSPERVAALEALPGWLWEFVDDSFENGLEHLEQFVAREGHSQVPASYTDETGFRLGSWVLSRRQDFKKGSLLPERVTALESLPDWSWHAREQKFEQGLARLREFVAQTGHAQVPDSYTDEANFPLGSWVGTRRGTYNKGKLSPERAAALEALPGWLWEFVDDSFEIGLEHLEQFVAREGHARVFAKFTNETGYPLGTWVVRQRQDYRKGKLSPERISVLETLPGWIWKVHGIKQEVTDD